MGLHSFLVVIILSVALFRENAAEPAVDQEQQSKTEELAKETQNPVANLISVPFQNNFNFGIGPNDWLAASSNRWTLPIGAGVGKIVKFGKLPVNFQLQAFDNVVTPQRGGADWQLRFQVQLLFPR